MQGLLPDNVATLAIDFSYLLVAFLFIMGLKAMSSPVTARRGIVVAGVGMLIGTVMSFLYPGMGNFPLCSRRSRSVAASPGGPDASSR